MSTVQDAFKIARSLLGDDVGLDWTDDKLMPKLVQAHNEMVSKLVLNGFPAIRKDTAQITVLANALSLGVDQPTDLIKPIKLDEHGVGESVSQSIPMKKVDFIPNYDKSTTLRYWAFNGNTITFLGSTQDRIVHLYYEGGLVPPSKVTDTLAITLSESFLGPRVVALCMSRAVQVGGNRDLFETASQMAEVNLSMVVRTAVKGEQNLPVRRKPFSYGSRRRMR